MKYALLIERRGETVVQETFALEPQLAGLDVRQVADDVEVGHVVRGDGSIGPRPVTTDALKAYAAARRRTALAAGTSSGLPTDAASRADVAQVLQSIDLGILSVPVRWKSPTGFVSVSRAQLLDMARAMSTHVQTAFDKEAAVVAAIDAGSITSTQQIDTAGWPG